MEVTFTNKEHTMCSTRTWSLVTIQDVLEAEIVLFQHSSMFGTYYEKGVVFRAKEGRTENELVVARERRNNWLAKKYASLAIASIIDDHTRSKKKLPPLRPLTTNPSVLVMYFDTTLDDYHFTWVTLPGIMLLEEKKRSVTCDVSSVSNEEVKKALSIGFEVLRHRRAKMRPSQHVFLPSQVKQVIKKNPPMITGGITRKKQKYKNLL